MIPLRFREKKLPVFCRNQPNIHYIYIRTFNFTKNHNHENDMLHPAGIRCCPSF